MKRREKEDDGENTSETSRTKDGGSGSKTRRRIATLHGSVGNQAVQQFFSGGHGGGGADVSRQQPTDETADAGTESEPDAGSRERKNEETGENDGDESEADGEEDDTGSFDKGTEISGADEIFYDIDARLGAVPNHFDRGEDDLASLTDYKLWASYEWNSNKGKYEVNWEYKILTVELPRWARFEDASTAEKREWARFMRNLREHEQKHVDICQEYRDEIPEEWQWIDADNESEVKEELPTYIREARQELEARHEALDDRTNHGKANGAKLQRPSSTGE